MPLLEHRFVPRRFAIGTAASLLMAGTAFAHHGWSWAEAEQVDIAGTIDSVTISPPHPSLRVTASDGKTWQVELGNPNQTKRAGFVEGSAAPGNKVVIRGNRSSDPNELRIKAVRITVDGKAYDIYPERIKE